MVEALLLEGLSSGEAVREYLLTLGQGNPYGFFKIWRQFKKRTSYKAVRQLFWTLKQLGLIQSVRFEESRGYFKKHLYSVVPGTEDDPRWGRPQVELYPDTALGKVGYERLKKRGLKPRGGRRREYRK